MEFAAASILAIGLLNPLGPRHGVEAIANATGVMRLDSGSSEAHPFVRKTSTPAILWVMVEVCCFTALFGLAAHALHALQAVNGDVNAPGAAGVRDYMLRYMGQIFVGGAELGDVERFVEDDLHAQVFVGLADFRAQKKPQVNNDDRVKARASRDYDS